MTEKKQVVNYMTWKDEDLLEKAKELSIDPEVFTEDGKLNRKTLVYMIKFADTKAGKGSETLVKSENGSIESLSKNARQVKIIFHNSDENDLPYVQIGLNGRAYYIPRNEEVWIPKEVLDGPIHDAIMERMKTVTDKFGNVNQEYKKVPRLTYQVLDMK